ncbi:MAG: hypothetical protein ABGW95_02845, partial [Candidatus Poseidoniia archaeon]
MKELLKLENELKDPDFTEFCLLVSAVGDLMWRQPISRSELQRTVDEYRRFRILNHELSRLKKDLDDELLKELERTLGKLQARGEAISRDLFQPDNYDALLGQREQLASIEEEIVKARNAGLDDAAARLEEQKELIEETIRNLEGGLNLEVSLDVARETLRERKAEAPRAKTKKEPEEEEAEEKRRAEEAQRERERLADQRKRLANIREELALGAALREGDEARAAAFYEQACTGGATRGCYGLGLLYYKGEGVPKDAARAAALFEQACTGGDTRGCHNLGFIYFNGDGVPKDEFRAAGFFEQACTGGDTRGCYNLGLMYFNGQGVPMDA